MALFGKKKKNVTENSELEVADIAENSNSGVSLKKGKDTFSRLKKKVSFKLKLKRKNVSGSDASGEDAANEQEAPKEKKKKEPKQKKPKKEKKPKAPKAPKAKKVKKSSDDGEKKGPPIVLIIIVAGALAVGTGAFFIFTKIINAPTVGQLLSEAQLLLRQGSFEEADAIYMELLKKDDLLVPAYIGHTDALVGLVKPKQAMEELTAALELTGGNPDIQKSLDALVEKYGPADTIDEQGNPLPVADTAPSAKPDVVVTFSEPQFEVMMRKALNKSPSEQFKSSELESIHTLKIMGGTHAAIDESIESTNHTDSYEIGGEVYTDRGSIKNLDDLKYFTSLRKLIVSYNSITDISGITNLKTLETIGLYCNDIADISPLSGLTDLKFLYIYNNRITDISPLSQLTSMQHLWLNKNRISDISAIKGMTQLTELFLSDNEIRDISSVANLKTLGFFFADDNQITDISAVKGLTELTYFSFINNPVTDTSPAAHVRNINKPFF